MTSRGGIFAHIVLMAPKPWQPIAYMALHITLCFVTMLLNVVWWWTPVTATVFVLAILTASVINGASFYFE